MEKDMEKVLEKLQEKANLPNGENQLVMKMLGENAYELLKVFLMELIQTLQEAQHIFIQVIKFLIGPKVKNL